MGKLDIFTPIYLLNITIYTNILSRYNKATMGEGAQKNKLPPEGRSMTVSKAQQASVNKYVKSNYDRINVTMPKGKRETIKAHAEAQGESVNGFINRAIDETMERDNAAPAASEGQREGE